jgi:retron-type reverse transcriptase
MAKDDKASLYRRIVQQTPEEVVLDRMRAYGYWSQREGLPEDPPEEAEERARIEAEIAQLLKTAAKVKDPDKALAEYREKRWEESKARRAERKAERLQQLAERRQVHAAYKQTTIVHAGEGVSAGLQGTVGDATLLKELDLPVVHTAAELAQMMGVKLSALRWLTYHRKGATVVHYHRYSIAKKTGGLRSISAPKPALAAAQEWVLHNLLYRLTPDPAAHGFVAGRSIVTNAAGHVNRAVVVNLDLRDFFPTVTFRRVKGLFHKVGYSEQVATVLALLLTEPPRVEAEVDGKVYHVALGQRVLPQGACTSPAVTNLLCRRLDRRLTGLAKRHGFTYTRYADDLTFSGDNGNAVGRLLRSVRSILTAEGFTEHPRKTKVMRRARRQEVTGLTVNDRPKVSRKELRELRAILHNAAVRGLESQNRDGRPDFSAYLRGRVEFVCMVDPERAPVWRKALARALGGR